MIVPATVSNVVFLPSHRGRCPVCGRHGRQLGRCNATQLLAEERCIDCFFSPVPMEYWRRCRSCGLVQPGDPGTPCDDCGQPLTADY